MEIVIALTTFAAVALLVSYLAQPRPNEVRRRILEGVTPNELTRRRSVEGGPAKRLVQPVVHRLGSTLGQLLPQNLIHSVDALLIQAGEPMPRSTFLSLWFVVAAGAIAIVFYLVRSTGWSATQLLPLSALILVYGIGLPYLMLRRRARKRQRQIERALPDALDLMLTCVEAGMGVDAAFSLVAQRTRGPLAEKLNEYLRQVGLGRSRREALEDIAERSGAESLMRLAAVVAQTTAVGTSMGDVLRIQAGELRTARKLKAQETASKAPIWMTVPLALCFMPAMGAVIVVPSILHLLDSIGELGLR